MTLRVWSISGQQRRVLRICVPLVVVMAIFGSFVGVSIYATITTKLTNEGVQNVSSLVSDVKVPLDTGTFEDCGIMAPDIIIVNRYVNNTHQAPF